MPNLASAPVINDKSCTTIESKIKQPPPERIASLDAFRGFVMLWIIGGEGLMAGLATLGHNRIIDAIVYELNHSPWQGLRFYDCIWPSFMLMVGVSVPLSFAKRSLTQTYHQQLFHAAKRAIVLFLLGSLRESVLVRSPYLVELSSALQPIAIAYFVAVLVVQKSWRFQVSLAAAILVGYGLLLAFVGAPGILAGSYQYNHNLVHSVDIALLGQTHWDKWPFAPEGWGTVLSTIPTVSTTLFGLLIGKSLLRTRSKEDNPKFIGGMGLALLLVGYLTSFFVPVVMKMWTISYGLMSAGCACLMFLFFYWLIDIRGYRQWAFPLAIIGMNAIFIYMLTSLVHLDSIVDVFTGEIGRSLPNAALLFQQIAVLAVEWLILFWMYKRKIFIKA
jgi:predicted acyltransferase